MSYGKQIVYLAERYDGTADGKRVRIVKDVEGPHAHLYAEDPEHVAQLSEEQARRLRDSLDEVLTATGGEPDHAE